MNDSIERAVIIVTPHSFQHPSMLLRRGRLVMLLLVILLMLLPISNASAADAAPHCCNDIKQLAAPGDSWQWVQSGGQISMQQAIRIAKRQFPGRVLSAKRSINRRGDAVFRIKILSNSGQIRTISVAADRGRG